ncbi:proline--tRNA ligase [Cohnella abietis]|uniref:Proline--tRNA ligase n=1 Tax=Cohnella abietis TaxID=2507935 RepID=A0A3T1D4B1_9BACL|nr:proline--tRNA ligase [Cohnella abietis]BBI32950.1 proline--tRNA ligase [Cohnella abietis]
MRQDKLLIPTLREAPSDAEAISHQLLVRAGFIRQVAAGVYTYLPLGWRVLKKVSDIVRYEMDSIDAQEILLPAMQPAELWQTSGRYSAYGPELVRLKDRHQREFILGPTHEEIITSLVQNEITSYRKLPLTLYQIQTKFRDERRPRFGLLRGREFLMKDAYSFHSDWSSLNDTYWNVHEAYSRIFNRCGLDFRPVEADAGAIGGEGGTHEFMALADIGEDTIVSCSNCSYAANLEKAETTNSQFEVHNVDLPKNEKLYTPGIKTIEDLVKHTSFGADKFVKTIIYKRDDTLIAVLIRGDHEVNELKIKNFLNAESLVLADLESIKEMGSVSGFIGPIGISIPILIDRDVASMSSMIVGANVTDYHLINVAAGRDFTVDQIGDFRNVTELDLCPLCSGSLQFHRGIEVGHVFKLGTKYSDKFGAKYKDDKGNEELMIMGCYGIGVSRILSAVVEQNHDANGIIWPYSISPYQVHLILISINEEQQLELAESLYTQLKNEGIEVLFDNRDERPGVKFKDADLIGIPTRITVGKQAKEGLIEYKERSNNVQITASTDEVIQRIKGIASENTSLF